ncbi:MAG: gliding motility-associated C-terminal domain-containing protein [Bacteroidetes bacterium]|nr:gliding motility-associated C-terminal domain-containing protein [Bacteroidota bacterium]
MPTNKIACLGDTVKFTIFSIEKGLTYQWRKGDSVLINSNKYAGVNTDTFSIKTIALSDTASNYNVIIKNKCGFNDTSNYVSLKLNTAPTILQEPTNKIVCTNDTVIFVVKTSGLGNTYQWRKGDSILINSLKFSGVNSDTLIIKAVGITDTASNYHVIVTGNCGLSDTSIHASLMLNSSPIITLEPINKIACLGDTVKYITAANTTGISYQWRKGNINLINGIKFSGVNSDTLVINTVSMSDTSSLYNVIAIGNCGLNDTSIFATLSTNEAPIITLEPNNQVACAGDSIVFNTTANGTGLTYQWRKGNTNLLNSVKISGVNTNKLTIRTLNMTDTAMNYNVIVIGTCQLKDTSINASLTVNQAPAITAEPNNQIVCEKSSASFTVSATGTNLSYQWRRGNTNILNSANITGANTATLFINSSSATDTGSNYNVIVSGTCLPNDTSIFVSLTNNLAPKITTEQVDQTVCANNAANFTVIATGTNLTYQWKKGNTNLVANANITGVNSATLTINQVSITDTGSDYHVIVSGLCAPSDTSRNAFIRMSSAPMITTEPVNQTACEKDSITFNVVASGTNLNYQWRKGNINLTNGASVSGANSASLTIRFIALSDTAFNYNVIVSGDCIPQDTSNNVALVVNPTPVALALSNSPICTDSSIILTANTISGSTYDWTGPNNYTSTNQVSIITAAKAVNAGNYTLVITSNNCKSQPSIVNVVINDCPQIAFFIPEGFSPNGDGINDVFFIRGLIAYPNNSIEIFNRWGEKVYVANPYLNDWNGSCNIGFRIGGTELPVGTYFYVFSKGDNTPVITGTIYLNN